MIELSPLRLRKAAERILVANSPEYIIRELLADGYPVQLSQRYGDEELIAAYQAAALRADFAFFDDAAVLVVLLALALKGSLDRLEPLPEPTIKPKFFDRIRRIVPSLVKHTREAKGVVQPRILQRTPARHTHESFVTREHRNTP
jgi:hypothetical protein